METTIDNALQFLNRLERPWTEMIAFGGAILVGLLIKILLFKMLGLYQRFGSPAVLQSFRRHMSLPLAFLIPLLMLVLALSLLQLPAQELMLYRRPVRILLIAVFAWSIVRLLNVLQDGLRHKLQIVKSNNLRERRLLTQLTFLRKVASIIITTLAFSLILMSFETARELGTGLLTSAGIAGIIIGLAAQKSIANLLAGFQIAFTQPIRIDDVLVVEGQWGRVEEITLTYVVLRLWDLRRLILPINYFLEKPFENWTRISAELFGTVEIYTDYTVPVDKVREELQRILDGNELWDKQLQEVLITDATERTVKLRVTLSAANSSDLFSLRCRVREKLIEYLRNHYPGSLPRTRVELPEQKSEDPQNDISLRAQKTLDTGR